LPELRGSAVDAEIARWAHEATLRWRRENNLDANAGTEVYADDRSRIAILDAMGYRRHETGFVAFKRELGAIPPPELPDGWTARAITEADIDSRATCQYEAFSPGSRTTPETWRALMANAPAYHQALDTVVVTPDGEVAAAAMCWLDERNRIGLFEPVATRPAYQRRGVGKALMLQGLRALAAHGMTQAFVATNATNAAARALYTSVGFQRRNHGYEMVWTPG
jgi:ribosomal protein S18 acetylase RimI-like enzyme